MTIPSSRCLCCNKHLNDAECALFDGSTPIEGDITVCVYCAHIMAFDSELKLRDLTNTEIADIALDPILGPKVMLAMRISARIRPEDERSPRNEGDY